MKALIRTKSGFYCSTVFAYYEKGWKSSVVILNENNSQLIIMPCNTLSKGIRRDVLIYDESREHWEKNGNWYGLNFIVKDKSLLHGIKKCVGVAPEILNKCKSLQTTDTFDGWNKIDTDEDINKLMNISLDFHDGFINNIEHSENDVYVSFKCWSCLITVKFINVIECDAGKEISWDNNCILEAAMCFENENIKWCVKNFCFEEYENQACYFIAKGAQYKIELDNTF